MFALESSDWRVGRKSRGRRGRALCTRRSFLWLLFICFQVQNTRLVHLRILYHVPARPPSLFFSLSPSPEESAWSSHVSLQIITSEHEWGQIIMGLLARGCITLNGVFGRETYAMHLQTHRPDVCFQTRRLKKCIDSLFPPRLDLVFYIHVNVKCKQRNCAF